MADVSQLIQKLENVRALVIGDAILDRYIFGKVERISREAPIPVFEISRTEERPGGACNTAVNVAQLATTSVLGVVGEDLFGEKLAELLCKSGVDTDLLIKAAPVRTTVKDRFIAKNQQMFRADIEERVHLPCSTVSAIHKNLLDSLEKFDCVISSDHQISFFSEKIFDLIYQINCGINLTHSLPFSDSQRTESDVSEADQGQAESKFKTMPPMPVYLDARSQSYRLFKGATLFKVNQADASAILGESVENLANLRKFCEKVLAEKDVEIVVVTLGDKGCYVQTPDYNEHFDVQRVEVSDVSGAGDTFLAVFSLIHFVTHDIKLAARLANRAASRVVQRFGTSSVTKSELVEDLSSLLF